MGEKSLDMLRGHELVRKLLLYVDTPDALDEDACIQENEAILRKRGRFINYFRVGLHAAAIGALTEIRDNLSPAQIALAEKLWQYGDRDHDDEVALLRAIGHAETADELSKYMDMYESRKS